MVSNESAEDSPLETPPCDDAQMGSHPNEQEALRKLHGNSLLASSAISNKRPLGTA